MLLFLFAVCLTITAAAQEVFVTGTVTTFAGEPLIGANILWDGYKGTLSDLDGNYYLTVPTGTELTVSFLGFQEVKVKAGKESEQLIDVVLAEGIDLPEVVVRAYAVPLVDYERCGTGCRYGLKCCAPGVSIDTTLAEITSAFRPSINYLQSAVVYPNPFAGELSVEFFTGNKRNVTVTLTDVSGRLVRQWSPQRVFAPQQTLHLRPRPGTLLPGIYFLRLTDETGYTEVRKVIYAAALD